MQPPPPESPHTHTHSPLWYNNINDCNTNGVTNERDQESERERKETQEYVSSPVLILSFSADARSWIARRSLLN